MGKGSYRKIVIFRVIVNQLLNIVLKDRLIGDPSSSEKYRFGEMPTPTDDGQCTERLFAENLGALLFNLHYDADQDERTNETHTSEPKPLCDDPSE